MTFEEKTKNYLLSLKNDKVIVDADIYGINEDYNTANCIGRIVNDNSEIEEKRIYVYEEDEIMKWKLLIPIDINI
jgi:hypothetical protein